MRVIIKSCAIKIGELKKCKFSKLCVDCFVMILCASLIQNVTKKIYLVMKGHQIFGRDEGINFDSSFGFEITCLNEDSIFQILDVIKCQKSHTPL